MARILEAYVGEYGSGKSEVALNRALSFATTGTPIAVADLDLVEPCYTLKPLVERLKAFPLLKVIPNRVEGQIGVGETGNILQPAVRWCLMQNENCIVDVGYGIDGYKALYLLEGYRKTPDLKIYVVMNASRPMTLTIDRMVVYIKTYERLDGMINNTHLGDESSVDVALDGEELLLEVERLTGIALIANSIWRQALEGGGAERFARPVWPMERYMPFGFWETDDGIRR